MKMEKKKNKIPRIQRIKKINKFCTPECQVYLIKYIPKKNIKINKFITLESFFKNLRIFSISRKHISYHNRKLSN